MFSITESARRFGRVSISDVEFNTRENKVSGYVPITIGKLAILIIFRVVGKIRHYAMAAYNLSSNELEKQTSRAFL